MSITIVFIIVLACLAIILLGLYFHYNNREVALRKEADAQNKNIAGIHDAMWKIIKEKAGVAENYRATFEKVYPELISGRYASDSSSMKWIQESNPDFDTTLYKDLMQAIESQRIYFQKSQQRMLDILRERETLINAMPAKFFISNKQTIDYTVIASDKTNEVMQSRIDNETLNF